MSYLRFAIARWLIHTGIRAMPAGASKSEITLVLRSWSRHVMQVVGERPAC